MEDTEDTDNEGGYETYRDGPEGRYGEYDENVREPHGNNQVHGESDEDESDGGNDDEESDENSYDDTDVSDEQEGQDGPEGLDGMTDQYDGRGQQPGNERPQAPAFKIPSRTISAVEHPFQIMDLDKGLETFGPTPQFASVSPKTVSRPSQLTAVLMPKRHSRSWMPGTLSFPCPYTFIPTTPHHGP